MKKCQDRKKDQSSVKATFLRELFRCLMLEAESIQDFTKWSNLKDKAVVKTENYLEDNGYVPTGDAFAAFWVNCKKAAR